MRSTLHVCALLAVTCAAFAAQPANPADELTKPFYALIEALAADQRDARQSAADAVLVASPQAPPKHWHATLARKRKEVDRERQRFLAPTTVAQFAALLLPDLERRRAAAIALIRDEVAYPYPNKDEAAQRRVDDLVAEVRVLWDDPLAALLKQVPAAAEHVPAAERATADIAELDGYFARYPSKPTAGSPPADAAKPEAAHFAEAFARAMHDAWQNDQWRSVRAANRQIAYLDVEEQRHLEGLNDYRALLGIAPLESDPRLHLAARGHSRDMAEKGFFAHESPLPGKAKPVDRMKLEGYDSSAGGENIHMGRSDGMGALDSWCHSSGHHRNLIGSGYTQIGVGRSGRHWTQNFGSLGPYALIKGGKPAMVAYLEQALSVGDDATLAQRLSLAERAAGLKLWNLAKLQLEQALALEPGNAKTKAALAKVEGMMR